MARKLKGNQFIQTIGNVDLGDADGDITLDAAAPGDLATVESVSYTIQTAGTGAAANHNITLEKGLAGAGTAIAAVAALDADGAAGLTVEAEGNGVTVLRGETLQLANAESAAISNGAIVNVVIYWRL